MSGKGLSSAYAQSISTKVKAAEDRARAMAGWDPVKNRGVYVVFDGPPSHESGRFIEVETADGRSVNVEPARWSERTDGTWVLGPFVPYGSDGG